MINEYISRLEQLGVKTTPTELYSVRDRQGKAVVYVVQPLLSRKERAHAWLEDSYENGELSAEEKIRRVKHFFEKQFAIARHILNHNKAHPEENLTVDIVANNWQLYWTDNGDYELWLNDVAQPMFKDAEGNQVYQFADIASYLIGYIGDWSRSTIVEEMSELYIPRELMMQMLWGYEDFGGLPNDALSKVNLFLTEYCGADVEPITEKAIRKSLDEDKWLLTCLFRYRNWSTALRWRLSQHNLTDDSVHMDISSQVMEVYSSEEIPWWFSCLAYEFTPSFMHIDPEYWERFWQNLIDNPDLTLHPDML